MAVYETKSLQSEYSILYSKFLGAEKSGEAMRENNLLKVATQ